MGSEARLAGPIYLDASALAKLYISEPESEALNAILAGRTDVMISDLGVTEVVSAIARRSREGNIAADDARSAIRDLLDERSRGIFRVANIDDSVHRHAESLLLGDLPLRAADALHIAATLRHQARTVATYDRRFATAAARLGLTIYPETGGREGM